jgi:hypothetical protein
MKKAGLLPVFQWKIPSKSEKGIWHIVSWYENNEFKCLEKTDGITKEPCFCEVDRKKRGRPCRHIRIAINYFKGLDYEEEYRSNTNKNI